MKHKDLTIAGRAHHWLVDGVLGGAIALVLVTVAQAALPQRVTPVADLPLRQPIAAAPPAPAALISFRDPVPGRDIGSPFGLRQMPWEEHGRLHAGVDIAAPGGEPILAAADGVVTRVGTDGGYGRFIELKHAGGLTTLYGHMGAYIPGLDPGMAVKAGTPVGRIGSTGSSTGDHLHFEIRDVKDRPLNPELFLGRAFATAADLPIRQALKASRTVRVAYVSRIPRSKQAIMQARADAAAARDPARDAARDLDGAGPDPDVDRPARAENGARPRAQILL